MLHWEDTISNLAWWSLTSRTHQNANVASQSWDHRLFRVGEEGEVLVYDVSADGGVIDHCWECLYHCHHHARVTAQPQQLQKARHQGGVNSLQVWCLGGGQRVFANCAVQWDGCLLIFTASKNYILLLGFQTWLANLFNGINLATKVPQSYELFLFYNLIQVIGRVFHFISM